MPTIVHFEIPTDDIERSKKFYNDLFGWNIEKMAWSGGFTRGTRVFDDNNHGR
jgi:predicted enzyme related to lactoylglutathione lyase